MLSLASCGTDDSAGTTDAGVDSSVGVDAASNNVTPDMSVADMGVGEPDASDAGEDMSPGLPITAENYCELTADAFCDYYLRCGRMAVPDKATCLEVFAEQCNGVYEPHYRALETQGMLELSPGGLQLCRSHLASVACEKQMFDLDGDCAQMWVGKVPDQGPCGTGIESFVCQPSATCVICLTLCGVCAGGVGACGLRMAVGGGGAMC